MMRIDRPIGARPAMPRSMQSEHVWANSVPRRLRGILGRG